MLIEEVRRLSGGEPQILAPQFQQIPPHPQARQRQRRIGPRPDDEPEPVGQRLVERRQHVGRRCGEVEIIHHDHTRYVDRSQLVRDRHRRVVGVGALALQQNEGVVGHTGPPRRDRRQERRHESCRLSIQRIARQPGQSVGVPGRPGRQSNRLAVAGRRRHQPQPIVAVQTLAHLRPRHEDATRPRNRQLRSSNNVARSCPSPIAPTNRSVQRPRPRSPCPSPERVIRARPLAIGPSRITLAGVIQRESGRRPTPKSSPVVRAAPSAGRRRGPGGGAEAMTSSRFAKTDATGPHEDHPTAGDDSRAPFPHRDGHSGRQLHEEGRLEHHHR